MKAAVNARYGQPDVIAIREIADPVPDAGEVLVRVQATTVSRSDCGMLAARPFFMRAATGLQRPKLKILGIDFAGIVAAAGRDVTGFSPGDRVFGLSPERFGCHAEYLCLPEAGAIARLPDSVGIESAVVCEGAWYAEMSVGALLPGQEILIYGASGAIGTAAVQLAKARGARVTAVVATANLALARTLGADRVVDYTVGDFTRTDARFDMVFDAVGKTSYARCRKLLKPDGVYRATDLGPWWSNVALSAATAMTGSGRVSIPLPKEAPATVDRLRALMADGAFRGIFDRQYRLDEIAEAYRYVATGQKTGIVRILL